MSTSTADPILAIFAEQEAERDVRREVATTLHDLERAQERLDAIGRRLTRRPAWEAEAESFLGPAREERARLAVHLGLLLAEWQLAGGDVALALPSAAHPRPSAPVEAPTVSSAETDDDDAPTSSPEPALSSDQIAAFKESFLKGASAGALLTRSPASAVWRPTLEQIMAQAGRPPNPTNEREHEREIELLETGTNAEHVARWHELPQEVQRSVLGMFVSRARGLKEIAALRLDLRSQLKDIMPRFPAFASEARPGHVNGLRIEHRPVRATWHADAMACWDVLRAIVPEDEPPALVPRTQPTPRPKPKKRAADEEESEPEKREIVPADWPGWRVTRGARAVIVGGEPRETSRERLEEIFDFGDLEWISSDAGRKHDALVERIVSGKIELVLIIQTLVNHKTSDKLLDAARQRRVPWALIGGYGASALQQGVDRYLERAPGR